ncbi:glycosyltransferase family 4 protein [Parasegetibacter sp. NRK P23]|nr:glycosyltransferase family 4 protein [Parasegetibacter sp. NRK P23]
MQKHSFYLVKYLAKRGVHVELYHTSKNADNHIRLDLFSEEEVKFIHPHLISYPRVKFRFPGHYILASYLYSKRIWDALSKNAAVDFVYAKGLSGWETIRQKKKLNGIKVGLKVHGYEMFQYAPNLRVKLQHLLLRPFFRYVNRRADLVFSYGGKITDIITEKLNVPEWKVVEIPTAIDSDWITKEEDADVNDIRKFVFVGRYERRKGIEELSRVIERNNRVAPFHFIFVGPVPEHRKLNLPNVSYVGAVTDTEVLKNVLRNADVLVCPSFSEGMPNVILEGMASACAIIASDVGAVGKMVDDRNGWLLQPDKLEEDLEAVFNKVLILEKAELKKKKVASIERVQEEFKWERIAEMLLSNLDKNLTSE